MLATLVIGAGVLPGCQDGEETPPTNAGATGGTEAGSGGSSRGGSSSSGEGGRITSEGGGGGHGNETPTGGREGGNGGTGDEPVQHLRFCSRLTTPVAYASVVAVDFDFAVAADCRVAGIPFLYVLDASNERAAFLNRLTAFNYALWGCADSAPPETFALIYEEGLSEDPRPITSADIDALIETYLAVTTPRLTLSSREIEAIDASLRALSRTIMSVESADYSRSTCGSSGGAGGAAGEAGAAGAAGEGGAEAEAGP